MKQTTYREEMYRLLMESARAVPWEFDCAANRMTYIGPQSETIFGYPSQAWYEVGFWESSIHPEDVERVTSYCLDQSRQRDQYEIEYRMRTNSGQIIWVLDIVTVVRREGEVTGLRGYLLDITIRKQSELQLVESEERFRQLAESSHDVIWLLDACTFQVLFVSLASKTVYGRDHESMCRDSHWTDAVHAQDSSKLVEAGVRAQNGQQTEVEYRIIKPDHTIRRLRTRFQPLLNSSGIVYRLMRTDEDVTDIRNLEERFRHAQKMEAIGTLAGGVAHDFNNLLSAIIGYAELTRAESSDPVVHDNISALLHASDRAKRLVGQILTFSRNQEQKHLTFDLQQIIEEAVHFLRATVPSNIDLQISKDADLPPITGDPTEIHQVIMNLAVNGVQAIDRQDGMLRIELRRAILDNSTASKMDLVPGSYVHLSVHDTGCGIPDENLARVFDPFFTTKAPGAGTGMGLSVVHGITKAHKGNVTVESQLGQGTVFHVYLPTSEKQVDPEEKKEIAPSGNGERILLVDDEEAVAKVMSRILIKSGYEVATFTDPEAGLHTFFEAPGRFDLVISDITMPKRNGVELAMEIKRLRPEIPILLASGFVPPSEAARIRDLGFGELLPKPVNRTRLLSTIQWLLTVSSAARRLPADAPA